MPLSDWINLGGELLELGKDMRKWSELSKRFPEAIEAHTELGTVCQASKLNFQNSTSFLGYSSTYWSKGRLLDGCSLACQALVDPLNRTIEVIYVPEEGVFVQRDSRVLWLLNWANEQVSVGRFHIYSKASTLHRPNLMRLAYHCTLSYDKLDKGELRRLIGNVLGNVKSTCTRFAPVIQALRDQSIDISRTGKLEGPKGKAVEEQFGQATRKLASGANGGESSRLKDDLTAWLTAQEIRYELLPDKSVVRFCEGTEASGTLQAYVTNLGVIVFEACPEWTVPEPLRWQVIESAYMAFANWGLAEYGSYQIDPTNGRLTYRAALDCQGCQKDGISRIALDNLFAGFVRAAPRIADFQYVGQLVMCEEEIDGRVQPFARYLSLKELIDRISATALANEEARERYLDTAERFFRDLGGVLNSTEV